MAWHIEESLVVQIILVSTRWMPDSHRHSKLVCGDKKTGYVTARTCWCPCGFDDVDCVTTAAKCWIYSSLADVCDLRHDGGLEAGAPRPVAAQHNPGRWWLNQRRRRVWRRQPFLFRVHLTSGTCVPAGDHGLRGTMASLVECIPLFFCFLV